MKERLLGFLFAGILIALAYRLGLDLVYQRFFSTTRQFELYWYLPFAVVPAVLLAALAFWIGFYRKGSSRGADLLVTLILLAIVGLTVPASYSCGMGCF